LTVEESNDSPISERISKNPAYGGGLNFPQRISPPDTEDHPQSGEEDDASDINMVFSDLPTIFPGQRRGDNSRPSQSHS
jgi:hypothetical protein